MIARLALAVALAGLALVGAAGTAQAQVLVFTKSSGYEHDVVKSVNGAPSLVETAMTELGRARGFAVTHTKDGRTLSPEGLARTRVVVIYTGGDLSESGTDGQPAVAAEGKALLLRLVEQGKLGVVGLHGAAATYHGASPDWVNDDRSADPFLKMIGAEFIAHGPVQPGRVFGADPRFPGVAPFAQGFELVDEWYSYKNFASDLHVLLWLGTWSLKNTGPGSCYRRAPYPIAWTRRHGKGRVFYLGLGHTAEVWRNPVFLNLVAGGIRWAGGQGPLPRPDVARVTPGYRETPPRDRAP